MGSLSTRAAAILILAPMLAPGLAMDVSDSDDLNDTSWTLAELPGHALLPERQPTLTFEGGRVHGTDGCNQYGASYAGQAGRFQLSGNMVATQMACPDPVMQQARSFTDALRQARTARIESGRLVLADAGGTTIAVFAAQSRELAGTQWHVTGYNNGKQAVVSSLSATELTMSFGEDGTLSGSAGCNDYTGTYSISDRAITTGQMATTRRMCTRPDGVMEQEAAFLKAVQGVLDVRIDGDRLELRSRDGALMVRASRTAGPGESGATSRARGGTAAVAASAAATLPAHGLRLPATFRGDLPCADCEAIRHHLDLWPDQVFHLNREWIGRPRGSDANRFRDEIGRWRVDPARNALILQGAAEMPLQFEIKAANRLRQLDLQGKPIASDLPYELTSDSTLTPADMTLALGGEMQYLADAVRFSECLTGRTYPMAVESDFVALERAYREVVSEPGARLYVTFEGTIAKRPRMEGEGHEPTVIVERFINVWPNQRCERAMADARLTNTYWRIVRLGSEPVAAAADRREPHVILRDVEGQHRYSATVGCNQMSGNYEIDGAEIRMSPAASTRVACPPPLDALEQRLGDALTRARRWRINASSLEFFDATGTAVALFEAVYL